MQLIIKCKTRPTLFSMNEASQQYVYAQDKTLSDFKPILREQNNFKEFDSLVDTLKTIKTSVYGNNANTISAEYKAITYCVDNLKTILMLMAKIIETTNAMNNLPKKVASDRTPISQGDYIMLQNIPFYQGLSHTAYVYGDELLFTYIESLLIQTQALLDKIAIYIKKFKLSINRNYYFSNLKDQINNLLSNNQNSKLYKCIKHEIDIALPLLEDLVVSTGQPNRKTFRNKIVHEETLATLTDNALVAYRTNSGRIVKFDIPIIDTYPCLMKTVEQLLNSVPRLAINIISAIVNDKYNTNLKTKRKLQFHWKNTFTDIRPYIVTNMSVSNKVKLNKFTLATNGFSLDEFYYVKRSLLR